MAQQRNWAGNVGYGVDHVERPTSLEQLADLVTSGRQVRALGSRHSFSDVAATTGVLVSTEALGLDVEVDLASRSVRVPAGTPYGVVAAALQRQGLALHNLGSLPHITVAGACATGTHGGGAGHQVLATAVREVELVDGTGQLRTLRRGDPGFEVAALSLGAAGVVVRLTLDARPSYDLRQDVYDDVPFTAFTQDPLGALGAAYSVSLFTDLRADAFTLGWLKVRDDGTLPPAAPTWRGGRLAGGQRHPVPGVATEHTTAQGVSGPWNERLAHFRLDHTPSAGAELQTELLVPSDRVLEAWQQVLALRERIAPLLMVCELRAVAADDLWLSGAGGRDVVGVHFTWHPDEPAVRSVLADLEPPLLALGARPHWGKVFVSPPASVRSLYPRLDDAANALALLDPEGRLRNAFVDAYLPR